MIVEFFFKNGTVIRKNIRYWTKYKILYSETLYRDLIDYANSLGKGKCVYLECYPDTELEKVWQRLNWTVFMAFKQEVEDMIENRIIVFMMLISFICYIIGYLVGEENANEDKKNNNRMWCRFSQGYKVILQGKRY